MRYRVAIPMNGIILAVRCSSRAVFIDQPAKPSPEPRETAFHVRSKTATAPVRTVDTHRERHTSCLSVSKPPALLSWDANAAAESVALGAGAVLGPVALPGVQLDPDAIRVGDLNQPPHGAIDDRCVFHVLSVEVVDPIVERVAVLNKERHGIEAPESLDVVRSRPKPNCQRCAGDFKSDALHRAVFNELPEQPEPQRPRVPLAASSEVAHCELDVVHTDERSGHGANYLAAGALKPAGLPG